MKQIIISVILTIGFHIAARPVLNGQCLLKGSAGLWWQEKEPGQYEIFRSLDGKNFESIGKSEKLEFIDIHKLEEPQALIYYKVINLNTNQSSGIMLVSNNSNLLAGGNFENEPLDIPYPKALPSLAGKYREKVTHLVTQDGKNGSKAYKLTVPADQKITVRNSSPWIRVVPNEQYIVQVYVKTEAGGVGSLGGQVLTEDYKICKGRRVPFFQGQKMTEEDQWTLFQYLENTPSDAALLQVWALCWESRGTTYFDDLAVIDVQLRDIEQLNIQELSDFIEKKSPEKYRLLQEVQKKLQDPVQALREYQNTVSRYVKLLKSIKEEQYKNRLMELR